MNSRFVSTLILIGGGVALFLPAPSSMAASTPTQIDKQTLAQVEALYGIDENAALTRLAKEYDAAVLARRVDAQKLPGFAGAWFDESTQSLVVATNAATDFSEIKKLGALPKLVAHNMVELDAVRDRVVKALQSSIGARSFRDAAVDVQTNTVLVEVIDTALPQASTLVNSLALKAPIRLIPVPDTPYGFSSNLRGAYLTRNDFTPQVPITPGHFQSCSIGASAEKVSVNTYTSGFVTAGHCGILDNTMFAGDQSTVIGYVIETDLRFKKNAPPNSVCYSEPSGHDGAWVQTSSPWIPLSQINGYSDPTINVSGKWAGMLQAPVGTTVCRYGSTTGGPFCGQVSALNVDYDVSQKNCLSIPLHGMIKVHGVCTQDGDSGGPLVMPTGQVQGTDTGSPDTHINACSINHSNFDVYFQPIGTTLETAGTSLGSPVAMLTTHGRSAPTVSNFRCPDPANSGTLNGYHVYTCNFVDFDSQGYTTISWTTSTGASSDDVEVSGNCTVPGPMVNVTLAISNLYGTTTLNRSFSCPTKPMP